MSNDVVIRVRVRQDARDGFAAVGKEAEAEGQRSGEKFTSRFGTVVGRMGVLLQEHVRRAGTAMGTQMGEHSGQSFVTRLGGVVAASTGKLQEIGRSLGKRVGVNISTEITESITRGVRDGHTRAISVIGGGDNMTDEDRRGTPGAGGRQRVDVDIDKPSLLSRFINWGKDAAGGFFEGFSDSARSLFSGDLLSTILKGAAILGIATALAAPLGAAIAAAVALALGGIGIGAGIAAAFKDPQIAAAAKELKGKLAKAFEDFGKPFRGPVADFLEKFTRDFLPKLERFGAAAGKILAPLTGKLGDGLIGFLENILPGALKGLENAAPVIEVLADRLPDIGKAIGDFFAVVTENSDDTAVFFDDLMTAIVKILGWTAKLVSALSGMYAAWHKGVAQVWSMLTDFWDSIGTGVNKAKRFFLGLLSSAVGIFDKILGAAEASLGWIPGLGGKLRGARAKFSEFQAGVNAELRKIPKEKTVTIRGYNSVGRAVANALADLSRIAASYATGGIVGQFPQQLSQAASGGIRNGLTLVGERGPEILDLAPGSRVWSNEDSRRMASQGGGGDGGWMEARWVGSDSLVVNEIMQGIQLRVRRQFSGDVQSAMGA